MLKTTSKMQSFILLLGFSPFTILPLAGLSQHQIFQVDWLPGGVCLECGQLPWLLFAALSPHWCAFFQALQLASPHSWLAYIPPENWTLSAELEPAARLWERVQPLSPLTPSWEEQLQPGPACLGKWKRKSVTLAAEVGMCILGKGQMLLTDNVIIHTFITSWCRLALPTCALSGFAQVQGVTWTL